MPGHDPLDLPRAVLDDAMSRLVAAADGERTAALAALVADYPRHRDELVSLCAALDDANRVLARTFAPTPADEPPTIDGYRVLRRLGEGAFGVVWLAEQHGPIQREVAIKLLRPGVGDRETLARFDAERRFLARLQHPAIAQIFAAGLLPDGRPWFVMEHVPGVPITAWCTERRLPVAARVRLFARLCLGVQHAHERGIVHRDVKPANVLVVEVDGQAQPKIIDFGIARALAGAGGESGQHTETGRVVGTPGYMSPEQAAGRLDEIDARSDLFGLGVLLYELLTGTLPWRRAAGTPAAGEHDPEPQLPSRRVLMEPAPPSGAAGERTAARATERRRLAAQLRGDLDRIVRKALSHAPADRYASALELAADLERHLRGDVVHAQPPSWRHRLHRRVRRHRAGLAAAAALLLLAGAGAWVLGGYRAEARGHARDAEAAVASLLARANDKQLVDAPEGPALRRTLAADALTFYDRFLTDRPDDNSSREGRARTLWTLSQVHWRLGQFVAAERAARESVADSELLLAAEPENGIWLGLCGSAERNVGRALFSLGRRDEARTHFERAIARLDSIAAPLHAHERMLVHTLVELATTLDAPRDAERAAAVLDRAAALQATILARAPDDPGEHDVLATIETNRLGQCMRSGNFAGVAAALARLDGWLAEGRGLHHNTTIAVHSAAAMLAARTGDVPHAIARTEQALAAARAWAAAEPSAPEPLANAARMSLALAALQERAGDVERARTLRLATLDAADAWATRFPADYRAPVQFATCAHLLAARALGSGRLASLAGAEQRSRRALELLALLPPDVDTPGVPRLRWLTRSDLGAVADAFALPDATTIWREAAAAMRACRGTAGVATEDLPVYTFRLLRAAHRELAAGDVDAAASLTDEAMALCTEHAANPWVPTLEPDVWRQRALVAAARRDWTGAVEHAAAAAAASSHFRAPLGAADALCATWLAAAAAGADATLVTDLRDRALAACESAVAATEARRVEQANGADPDPWLVIPLARLHVRVAQLQHARGEPFARELVADALATLTAARGDVHAIELDETVCDVASALLAR